MFRAFIMMVAGFIIGLILSENAQVIRHSVPADRKLSGNINQFIVILGIGNSGNKFEINSGDEVFSTEEEDELDNG